MKYCGVWLILLLCIVNLKLAGCFKCDFDYLLWWGYTCRIQEDSIVSEEKHLDKKNDDDVKDYNFIGKNNTKHFTQQELTLIYQKFKNLEKFGVFHIKSVDDNLFEEYKNLKRIWIEDSELEKISENLFFYQSGLRDIDLRNNKLRTLPENVFLNQRELVDLDLYYNLISCLPPNIFKSLTKLRSLHLEGNQIQSLNPKWFETLQSLTDLWLNDNKIQDLPKNVFVHLKNLGRLYLAGNLLTTIHSDSFGILRKLYKIDLGKNKINSIDAKFFDNTDINDIDMSGNVCSKEYIDWRNIIKEKLSNCTSRYQPRVESISISRNVNVKCGTYQGSIPLIHRGTPIKPNEYPWNVALIDDTGNLFCGGTIVSNRHIVTAAHCMKGKLYHYMFGTGNFSVMLGAHNHTNPVEEGRITSCINSINIHPEWNVYSESYDADIAILELANELSFNKFIRPICIPNVESEVARATTGTVVGFGITENRTISDVAKTLDIPINNHLNCTQHSSDHRSLSSPRTFCGGSADGSGVCSGDSGSGVYVPHKNVYYLRGIVSSSLFNIIGECDVDRQAVFTDVPKFYGWIESNGTDDNADYKKITRNKRRSVIQKLNAED